MNERFDPGQIVLVNLDPTKGAEKRKTRACVVLEGSLNKLGLCIVVPITDAKGNRSSKIFIPITDWEKAKLSKPSVVDTYQIRSIDKMRVLKKLGKIDNKTLHSIRVNLSYILGLAAE